MGPCSFLLRCHRRTAERAFFGCFGFFGSLRCLSRLPIGVSFHVVKSFGALGTRHSSDCYLAPRISRIWPDMLMPNAVVQRRAERRRGPSAGTTGLKALVNLVVLN